MNIRDVVALGPVIPELMLANVAQAVPTARALCAAGVRVMEISMRSPEATACIDAVRKDVPDAIVGAGALTRAVDFAAADRAGALFGTALGLTPELAAASRGARFPLLPGVMTPTEVLIARNTGFMVQKLYASQSAGMTAMLNLLQAGFPDVVFVPTGALTSDLARDFAAQANVPCVAGSWAVLQASIGNADWQQVEAWARDTTRLFL